MTAVTEGPVPGSDELARLVLDRVRDVPDFPSPGVVFKDITPLLADGPAMQALIGALADRYRGRVDVIAGVEARGFILAAPLAVALGVGMVPVRKAGKLPGRTAGATYDLEYGSASIEVHEDAVIAGHRVLLVDDVLATGGTALASWELMEQVGGEVVELLVLMELGFLDGRSRLGDRAVHAVATV